MENIAAPVAVNPAAPAVDNPAAAAADNTVAGPSSGLASLPYQERYFGARDEIPAFESKNVYTPEAFYTKVVFSCDTYQIPAEDRIRIAVLPLEGDAAKFQAELTASGEMPSTLEGLYNKLKARYPVPPEETAPYLLLHKISMSGNQLARFVQEFNRQVSRGGSGEQAWQAMLQELFLSGLSGNLRQIVEQSRPELGWASLESLQSAATKAQQTLHLKGRPAGSGCSHESGHKRHQGSHPDQRQGKRSNLAARPGPSRPYCTFCKKPGYPTEDCRIAKRIQASKN